MEEQPKIEWNGKEFVFSLPTDDGSVIEGKLEPALTYVVRIREAGDGEWSVGFVTPFTHCTTVGMEPNTQYEFSVTAKNAAGEIEPAITRVRTKPDGTPSNVILFPRK